MSVDVKICGLTDSEAVSAAIDNFADFIGFVFFDKSPRNVTPKMAKELSSPIPSHIKKVAVLVDPSDDLIRDILRKFEPDYLQLHGKESVGRVWEIKLRYNIPIIKAFSVRDGDDIAASLPYQEVTDMFLFDAKAPKESILPGGNGLSFDWNLLANREFSIPWMLSGGLNAANVRSALDISGAKMVDASSSLESEPGTKDPALIIEFLDVARG